MSCQIWVPIPLITKQYWLPPGLPIQPATASTSLSHWGISFTSRSSQNHHSIVYLRNYFKIYQYAPSHTYKWIKIKQKAQTGSYLPTRSNSSKISSQSFVFNLLPMFLSIPKVSADKIMYFCCCHMVSMHYFCHFAHFCPCWKSFPTTGGHCVRQFWNSMTEVAHWLYYSVAENYTIRLYWRPVLKSSRDGFSRSFKTVVDTQLLCLCSSVRTASTTKHQQTETQARNFEPF